MTKPSASILLVTCNQERFVKAAAESILQQTGGAFEILISDDASDDGTYAILEELIRGYSGPHTVHLLRNRKRLVNDHVSFLVKKAASDFLVLAHGDDIAMPERCATLLAESRRTGASLVSSNAINIDENDREIGLMAGEMLTPPTAIEIARGMRTRVLEGAHLAWRREVYERFPWLNTAYLPLGHDSLLTFRATLLSGICYINRPLLRRRTHSQQWSRRIIGGEGLKRNQESCFGQALSVRQAMLRDLRHAIAQDKVSCHEFVEIENALEQISLERLSSWIELRDNLARQGLQSTWIPADEHWRRVEQHPWTQLIRSLGLIRRLIQMRVWRAKRARSGMWS